MAGGKIIVEALPDNKNLLYGRFEGDSSAIERIALDVYCEGTHNQTLYLIKKEGEEFKSGVFVPCETKMEIRPRPAFEVVMVGVETNAPEPAILQEALKPADRVLELVDEIEDDRYQAKALAEIAQKRKDTKLLERAIQIADGIEDVKKRVWALADIAKVTGDSKILDRIATIIANTRDGAAWRGAMNGLADVLVDLKRFDDALTCLEAIGSRGGVGIEGLFALNNILEYSGDVKHLDRAIGLFNNEEVVWKSFTFQMMVPDNPNPKFVDRLARVAEGLNFDSVSIHGLIKIAKAAKSRKLFAKAVGIIDKEEVDFQKADSLKRVAIAMADAGFIKQAVEVAEKIEDSHKSEKCLAFVHIAKASRDRRFFDKAAKLADEFPGNIRLSDLAAAMAKAGFIGNAEKIVEKIEEPEYKALALKDVALAKKDRALFDRAAEIASTIELERSRYDAFVEIASALLTAGFFDGTGQYNGPAILESAVSAAGNLEDTEEQKSKSYAYQRIAGVMVDAKLLERAAEVAGYIEDKGHKPEITARIAVAMAVTK